MLKLGVGLKALFGFAAAAAAAGAVYVVPQILEQREANVAEPAAVMEPDSGTSAPPLEAPVAGQQSPAETETDVASLSTDWVMPSFDVLRVEPDGSTVIAGKAEPDTTLNIMNGETVIASTQVGPSGDFAAILDAPLDAGDYQLTLRIVDETGAMRDSEEVATVSIPDTEDGELLAMVSRPGEASRLIAQPAAPEPAAPAPEVPQSSAAGGTAQESGGDDTAGEAASSDATADAAPSAAQEERTATGDNAGAVETPDLPEMSSTLTTSAPQVTPDRENAGPPVTAAEDERAEDAVTADTEAVTETSTETEIAAVSPEPADTKTTRDLPDGITVRVDAIEIEGDRIFIAGSATSGYPVQVSADGVLIGTAKADETGRYIIEAEAELAVGDHIINADLLDETGATVLLRATVPFNRPEGEALAAVAPEPKADSKTSRVTSTAKPSEAAEVDADVSVSQSPAREQGSAAAPVEAEPAAETLILPDIAGLSQMREDAFDALGALEQLLSGPDAPEPAQVEAARKSAVEKLKAAAMADLPKDSGAEALAVARSMRAQAEAALAVIAPPATQAADGSGPVAGASDDSRDLTKLRETFRRARSALSRPVEVAVDDRVGQTADGGPVTITQAPLASAPGAVIIRRGDTLWRISRRTYGQGVRYTTIYLANRSQIENPDRIQPGQVFSVPDTPLENAEELHRERLKSGRKR